MDFTQTQRLPDIHIPMKPTFTMDRFSGSGDTNSTIDSPFGSSLNTPVDEDAPEPFATIGKRLKELESQDGAKKTELHMEAATRAIVSPRRVSQPPQPQVELDQDQSFNSTTAEENVDLSSRATSDTSISEKLLSSFPAVPFSSPTAPGDQVLSGPPALDLTLSLQNLRSQFDLSFTEPSPVIVPPSPNFENSSPDDSPLFVSPEIDQGFNAHSRASSLYNLPNDPITISQSMEHVDSESSFYSEVEAPISSSIFASKTQLAILPAVQAESQATSALDDLASEYDLEHAYVFSALRSLDFSPFNIPNLLFKFVCFIPWCALVGATILLSPTNIEKVAFSPGLSIGLGNYRLRLDYISPPEKGLRRFAHWAEVAVPHVMIFLGLFGCGLYYLARMDLGLGISVAIGAMTCGQMVLAWQDFYFGLGGPDDPQRRRGSSSSSLPLGQDDRESVWMVMRMYVMGEESKMWFTGSLEKGIFVVDGGKTVGSEKT
ncbi:hypothetical protein D9757_006025 [Collybiopsis confluens]|uniref:Uncharacterized protein n=1 Tax=Collybiopsis confluens TaxID=2823264 RepID=A0A8H5HUL5_9AGAR|nr:hypothetical protein D9757_006025 [Collybiopsis confluens]